MNRTEANRNRGRRRTGWPRAALFVLAVSAAPGVTLADDIGAPVRLQLRAHVVTEDSVPTLRDVLTLDGVDARLIDTIADQPVLADASSVVTAVTHQQVIERLEALGVNMARVLVSGASRCRITPAPEVAEPVTAGQGPAPLVRSGDDVGRDTLAGRIRRYVELELKDAGGRVDVEFELAGQEFLSLTTPPFHFSIRGERGPELGLRLFRVSIYRDDVRQRTVEVAARVRLIKDVLVAARPLNAGSTVRREHLTFAQRIFDQDPGSGLVRLDEVVGQQVARFVPEGEMLAGGDFRRVDLVKRSRPVTVVGSGPVSVHLTGTALDSGTYGDAVRVRLGDRRDRRVVRGVVAGVATVELAEGTR